MNAVNWWNASIVLRNQFNSAPLQAANQHLLPLTMRAMKARTLNKIGYENRYETFQSCNFLSFHTRVVWDARRISVNSTHHKGIHSLADNKMKKLAEDLFVVPSLYAWLTLITLIVGKILFSMIISCIGTYVKFAPVSELTQKVRSLSFVGSYFL